MNNFVSKKVEVPKMYNRGWEELSYLLKSTYGELKNVAGWNYNAAIFSLLKADHLVALLPSHGRQEKRKEGKKGKKQRQHKKERKQKEKKAKKQN